MAAQGFRLIARHGLALRFAGAPAAAKRAFGESQAPGPPPASLSGLVSDVEGLDGTPPLKPQAVAGPRTVTPSCSGAQDLHDTAGGYLPAQLASPAGYGHDALINAGYDGDGESIAFVEFSNYLPSDIAAYQSCFGLSVPITDVPVAGGNAPAQLRAGGVAGRRDRDLGGPWTRPRLRLHRAADGVDGVGARPDRGRAALDRRARRQRLLGPLRDTDDAVSGRRHEHRPAARGGRRHVGAGGQRRPGVAGLRPASAVGRRSRRAAVRDRRRRHLAVPRPHGCAARGGLERPVRRRRRRCLQVLGQADLADGAGRDQQLLERRPLPPVGGRLPRGAGRLAERDRRSARIHRPLHGRRLLPQVAGCWQEARVPRRRSWRGSSRTRTSTRGRMAASGSGSPTRSSTRRSQDTGRRSATSPWATTSRGFDRRYPATPGYDLATGIGSGRHAAAGDCARRVQPVGADAAADHADRCAGRGRGSALRDADHLRGQLRGRRGVAGRWCTCRARISWVSASGGRLTAQNGKWSITLAARSLASSWWRAGVPGSLRRSPSAALGSVVHVIPSLRIGRRCRSSTGGRPAVSACRSG